MICTCAKYYVIWVINNYPLFDACFHDLAINTEIYSSIICMHALELLYTDQELWGEEINTRTCMLRIHACTCVHVHPTCMLM